MGGTIFISYRRDQDAGFAGRLFDRLERTFRRKALFMDVDSIPPGQDFPSIVEARVAECDAALKQVLAVPLTPTPRPPERVRVARRKSGRAKAMKDFALYPEMVALPVGEFLMGSKDKEEGRYSDEGPQHRVSIDRRFAIGRYAVTFDEYDHFCAATERKKPEDKGWGRGRRPVIEVSWRDALAYCAWLANETGQPYRLPTEAEWEYAARAGTTTRYAFGDAITPKNANYSGSKLGRTTEVGAYPPNAWGLYDMHGNVWEWVEDIWHDNYKGAPTDGTAWTDGEGENSSRNRVSRGGPWSGTPRDLRSAIRSRDGPDDHYSNLGFRVARMLD